MMSLSVGLRFAVVRHRQQPTTARQEVRTVATPTNASQIDRRARADWIDEVLADSFPASDPPSWTPGIARLNPSLPDSPGVAHNWTAMLHTGDLLPHFELTDLYGCRVDYSSIWQRKNLVLVMLSDTDPSSRSYADQLMARGRDSKKNDTEWVVTCDRIAGMPNPGAVVADRWGELMHVAHAPDVAHLPVPDELVEWVDYVRHRCPECEGEAR
jgi:hypothetical protein